MLLLVRKKEKKAFLCDMRDQQKQNPPLQYGRSTGRMPWIFKEPKGEPKSWLLFSEVAGEPTAETQASERMTSAWAFFLFVSEVNTFWSKRKTATLQMSSFHITLYTYLRNKTARS